MKFQHISAYVTENARTDPGGTAIMSGPTVLSNKELEERSNRVANFFDEKIFRDTACAGTDCYVCVMLDRSAEIITALIGLLKAGLVFVPISPDIPGKRVRLLLEETKTRWVVTSAAYREKFKETFTSSRVNVVTETDFEDRSHDLEFEMRYNKYSYIYFTSGSTGIPKGVLGRHKSLDHFIRWEVGEFGIDRTYRFSQLTPPTFDPYLRDILVPLAAGATICIPGYDILMNPGKLISWIDENKIGLIHIVPSLFKLISNQIDGAGHFPDLKYILLAGELLRGNDIRKFIDIFKDRIQLVNIYGPTETTLAKFFYRVQPRDVEKSIIPVGRTIKGAAALILDEQGQKCLTGNTGEIHIRTPYISSGYFNNKELNRKVFIKNPFSDDRNDIIYKTGDMGRLLFDGNIELTGRVDGQVKIRGNRVETGEIENLLLSVDYIKEAAVVDKEHRNGEKYLCAYLVLEDGGSRPPDSIELKHMLSQSLPAYMLPSFFIPLKEMPRNPNGKTNKNALRKMEVKLNLGKQYVAPKDELEKQIAEIWKSILKLDKVGINDSFFDIGGTSLGAIEVGSKINTLLGEEIPIVKFFEFPTIGLYVKRLRGNAPGTPPPRQEETGLKSPENRNRKRRDLTVRKRKLKELANG